MLPSPQSGSSGPLQNVRPPFLIPFSVAIGHLLCFDALEPLLRFPRELRDSGEGKYPGELGLRAGRPVDEMGEIIRERRLTIQAQAFAVVAQQDLEQIFGDVVEAVEDEVSLVFPKDRGAIEGEMF